MARRGAPLPAELRALYVERSAAIRARLAAFAAVPAADYFYEVCYCLLTPQSSARHADRVVQILRGRDFFARGDDPEPILRAPAHYVRFHRTKARRLLRLRAQWPEVAARLAAHHAPADTRAWLVAHVDGLSLKEAGHALRNIGVRDLAILDRHVLTHLVRCGVVRRLPRTLTPRRYLAIERKFRAFARRVEIPMDELDLLFWSAQTGEILK